VLDALSGRIVWQYGTTDRPGLGVLPTQVVDGQATDRRLPGE
jgi:hypothetical protein